MATSDMTIMGLRTQILENWRYVHPEHANVVVVTTHEYIPGPIGSPRIQAVIAENRSQGDRIFFKSQVSDYQELALRHLLHAVTELVEQVIKDTPATSLQIKPLTQTDLKTNDHRDEIEEEVEKPKQSPKDEEFEVSHNLYHALCDVINLRFQKLAR